MRPRIRACARCSDARVGSPAACRLTAPSFLLHVPDEYAGRSRLSPDLCEESETDPGTDELPARIFVALFDYDPLTMSPNPDAAEEELPFKEGQVIKVRTVGRVQGMVGHT